LIDGFAVHRLANTKAEAIGLLFTRSDRPISNRYAPEVEGLYEQFGPSAANPHGREAAARPNLPCERQSIAVR
jgi:hypothetical protein